MEEEKAHVPKLHILNSTSPGQVGYSSPELRGSVFGYFLAQGLSGAADVESGGNHNGKVSLRELDRYLKAKVSQWVIENRDDVQEPMLLPPLPDDAPDVPLVFRRSDVGTVMPPPAEPDPRWKDPMEATLAATCRTPREDEDTLPREAPGVGKVPIQSAPCRAVTGSGKCLSTRLRQNRGGTEEPGLCVG